MEIRLEKRGRIVIPSEVRRLLGLREGSILILEVRNGRILLTPKKKVSVDDIFGIAGVGEVEIEDAEKADFHPLGEIIAVLEASLPGEVL